MTVGVGVREEGWGLSLGPWDLVQGVRILPFILSVTGQLHWRRHLLPPSLLLSMPRSLFQAVPGCPGWWEEGGDEVGPRAL